MLSAYLHQILLGDMKGYRQARNSKSVTHRQVLANGLKKGVRPSETMRAPGAGNGVRTRDTKLGKLVLYHLSYARPQFPSE
jgi:hypothetical protein